MPILGIIASQISGKLWQPDGAYDALATVTVGATSVASITFAGIPNTYKHLQVRGSVRGDYAGWGSAAMKFNSSNASYVEYHSLYGDGSSAAANASTASTAGIQFIYTNGTNASIYTGFIADILDYTSTSKNKTVRSLSGNDLNGSGFIRMFSGLWYATPEAINTIAITFPGQNITQYSQFSLYGVR